MSVVRLPGLPSRYYDDQICPPDGLVLAIASIPQSIPRLQVRRTALSCERGSSMTASKRCGGMTPALASERQTFTWETAVSRPAGDDDSVGGAVVRPEPVCSGLTTSGGVAACSINGRGPRSARRLNCCSIIMIRAAAALDRR